jgi:peptide/nickel transport system ATP-binding protein
MDAGPPPAPLLQASGIGKQFRRSFWLRRAPHHVALADVSLAMSSGEIMGLVGESGSGKTTLGRIVAGLETADAGTLDIDGRRQFGPREASE